MKKSVFLLLLILFLLPAALAGACAEESGVGFRVELPEAFTAGRNESLSVDLYAPNTGRVLAKAVCSDPDACFINSSSIGAEDGIYHGCIFITFRHMGQFTLTFTIGDAFTDVVSYTYTSTVTVEQDAVTSARAAQDLFFARVGETVPIGLELGEGVLFQQPYIDLPAGSPISLSEDGTRFTCLAPGLANANICYGHGRKLGSFSVVVADESRDVRIQANGKGSVGEKTAVTCLSDGGSPVYARMEITEGADRARLEYSAFSPSVSLTADAPGYFTVAAYGTDGSADTARIRIYEIPASVDITVPKKRIAAGEETAVCVLFPDDSWYGVHYSVTASEPDDAGIDGPVAMVSGDGVVRGLMPGTCTVAVYTGRAWRYFPLTVTDSPRSLRVVRPEYGFDMNAPCRLSIRDDLGTEYPAQYLKKDGPVGISVSPDGELSAEKEAKCTVAADLDIGVRYTFTVRSASAPSRMEPKADLIRIPADCTTELPDITADVPLDTAKDVIVTSSDESVVQYEPIGRVIRPRGEGAAILTVWSRYNEVCCRIAVVVTEPVGMLFIDGSYPGPAIYVPYKSAVDLPTVRDWNGNKVKVSWRVSYASSSSEDPNKKCVAIEDGRIRAVGSGGNAHVTATAPNGASIGMLVYTYRRAASCTLSAQELVIPVGGWDRIDISCQADNGTNAEPRPQDVKLTLAGDGCVSMERDDKGAWFTALSEGTATLTVKLTNGYTAAVPIRAVMPEACRNGHDPQWTVAKVPTALKCGLRELRCSGCGLLMGSEPVPCTGKIAFAQDEVFLTAEGPGQLAELFTSLDGDRRYPFAWRSSDTSVAGVLADHAVAAGNGTAVITASLGDCAEASCRVHVIEPRTVTLPAGIAAVEPEAFAGTYATRVVIPEGVTRIESRAFADCPYLFEVVVPSTLTYIAEDAFDGSERAALVPGYGG